MAVYKIIGTFGNSFSNSDQINLFVNSGTIVPSTTTKFQLEQGIFVTVDSGVTITAYTSNGTCATITDSVDVPNTPVPEPTEEFSCYTVGLNLVIDDGEAGDAVTGAVSLGTISGFTPTHYDANVTTYSASINIPSGYSNTGDGNQYISCDDTVTVTTTTEQYTQSSELQGNSSEFPTYRITWPIGQQTVSTNSSVPHTPGPITKTVPLTANSILVYVTRTDPDNTVDDSTQITFSRNNAVAEYTVSKNNGDVIQTEAYTFTGVSDGDTLKVLINEG
jgi:hypothetical protein